MKHKKNCGKQLQSLNSSFRDIKSCPQVTSPFLHVQTVYFFLSTNSVLMLPARSLTHSPHSLICSIAFPSFSLSSGLLFDFTGWSLFRFPRLELPQCSLLPTSVSGLEARDTMEKKNKLKRSRIALYYQGKIEPRPWKGSKLHWDQRHETTITAV